MHNPPHPGTFIEGVDLEPLLITPQVFGDDRGFFYESWNQRRFDEVVGQATSFMQDNPPAPAAASCGACTGCWWALPTASSP
jgi:hypothetical protein